MISETIICDGYSAGFFILNKYMENVNPKLQKAKEFVDSSYQKLQKELAEGTQESSLSIIQIMRDNLRVLEMVIKLDIINNECKEIEGDFQRIDEYVKLKRRLDFEREKTDQPF